MERCIAFPSHSHNSPLPLKKLPLPSRITASAHSKRFRIGCVSVLVSVRCRCPACAIHAPALPWMRLLCQLVGQLVGRLLGRPSIWLKIHDCYQLVRYITSPTGQRCVRTVSLGVLIMWHIWRNRWTDRQTDRQTDEMATVVTEALKTWLLLIRYNMGSHLAKISQKNAVFA